MHLVFPEIAFFRLLIIDAAGEIGGTGFPLSPPPTPVVVKSLHRDAGGCCCSPLQNWHPFHLKRIQLYFKTDHRGLLSLSLP